MSTFRSVEGGNDLYYMLQSLVCHCPDLIRSSLKMKTTFASLVALALAPRVTHAFWRSTHLLERPVSYNS
jgi:hypothetical protein